ncbi:MAG: hypothetical protein Q7N50_13630 [Armatimonadota bacterium]|nr:hypothetical protein [Armatimonadota bacterium]
MADIKKVNADRKSGLDKAKAPLHLRLSQFKRRALERFLAHCAEQRTHKPTLNVGKT